MVKGRKWKRLRLVGLLLGGMAVLTSFFIKQRKFHRRVY